ncbi:MAG: MarR family transcriptional regulator [Lachnospiraceae bacterium]
MKEEKKKKKEQILENYTNCTQCSRHCPVDALRCKKGKNYLEGLLKEGHGDQDKECIEREHRHGRHRHGCRQDDRKCCKRKHERHEECLRHGEQGELFDLFRACGHILYHRSEKQSGQGRILYVLSEQGEMSQKDLQELFQVKPGSMSEILSKLEHKGFIRRIKDDEDKRKAIVTITEAGKIRLEERQKVKNNGDPFAALDEAQQEELKKLLRLLLDDWQGNQG